jgi:ferric-dicitrate binding protein FerR (iron transport regulator)
MKARTMIASLLLAASALLAANAPLAVVVRSKGLVTAGSETAMKPVAAGLVLHEGARLKTGPDGRALVRFLADQSIAEIKPGTTVDFATRGLGGGQGTARQVLLRAGEAAFGVTPGKGRDLRFETATTVASVRGTGFGVSVTPSGTTRIFVEHGVVRVCNPLTGESIDLYPGQEVYSTWYGFATDSTGTIPLPSGPLADTTSDRKLEIDFLEPVTGTTRTLGIRTKETSP